MNQSRRRMMGNKINWDVEWNPSQGVPDFIEIGTFSAAELTDGCYTIHSATGPSNKATRWMGTLKTPLISANNSFIIEFDIEEKVARLATSYQGGLIFATDRNSTAANLLCLRRGPSKKIPGTNFYKIGLDNKVSNDSSSFIGITDGMRFKLRILYDKDTRLFTLKVGNKTISRTLPENTYPRSIYSRYSNNGYINIYGIKIKALD